MIDHGGLPDPPPAVTYPAKEIAEIRGLLGNPTTAELTDTQITDAISECQDQYSAFRPVLAFDLENISTSDTDDSVAPPADSMGILAVMVDVDEAYTGDEAGAKRWLKDHAGTDDTMSDLVWTETGGKIVFDDVPAGIYPVRVYYKQKHAWSATVATEGATGLTTLPIRDRVNLVNGVVARCLITLAGYAGELTFGTARISKENIRRQGNDGLKSFNRWIRQGYTP
jgi:hypothetical protein